MNEAIKLLHRKDKVESAVFVFHKNMPKTKKSIFLRWILNFMNIAFSLKLLLFF